MLIQGDDPNSWEDIWVSKSAIKTLKKLPANKRVLGDLYLVTFLDGSTQRIRRFDEVAEERQVISVAGVGYSFIHLSFGGDEFGLWETPIIAFAVSPDGSSYPITPSPDAPDLDGSRWAIRFPDGRIDLPFESTYDSEEAFRKAMVEHHAKVKAADKAKTIGADGGETS